MAATLTEKTIPKLEPRAKPYEVPDRGGKESVRELRLRIQPSGAKNFYVQIARGKRERIGSTAAYTLTRARVEAKRLLGLAADGHDFRAGRDAEKAATASTLRAYLDGPFKTHAESNIASHRNMLARIRKAFHHVLDTPMANITELHMAKWRKRRSKVSLETQRRELTYLKAVLNHAVANKVIPTHQLSHYRVRGGLSEGEGETKVRYLTDTEEKRLRAGLDAREARIRQERASANVWRAERGYDLMPDLGVYADHLKPMVLLALNTGLRRGDLFDLKWDHIDLGRRQIRKIINKTSHARRKAGKRLEPAVLPLSSEAHAILNAYPEEARQGYVFTNPRTGGPLTDTKKSFEAVLNDAGITGFRFHDLRHTFASRLVMAGVDLNTVRELMTHADIKMTLVYAHLSPDHKAAALDRAFGGLAK